MPILLIYLNIIFMTIKIILKNRNRISQTINSQYLYKSFCIYVCVLGISIFEIMLLILFYTFLSVFWQS